MHIAMESKSNDKAVWKALEDAALAIMHLLDTKQVC